MGSDNMQSRNGKDENDDSWIPAGDVARLQDIARYDEKDPAVSEEGIKSLPAGTMPTRYMGEGAANVVFEFSLPKDHPSTGYFRRMLLRVSKVKKPGERATFDYIGQHKYFLRDIKPHLGGYTVRQELVKVHYAKDLIKEMNEILKDCQKRGLRREKFNNTWAGETDWAFGLENMMPEDQDNYKLIEFKPKWLIQSPTAPTNAIRCRQCAASLHSFVKKPDLRAPLPSQTLCPLTLGKLGGGHYDFSSPFRVYPALYDAAASPSARSHFEHTLDAIANHPVIDLLRNIQGRLDKHGPLNAELSPGLEQAMTLRDCTAFAQVPMSPASASSRPASVALCDFDWKDPKRKGEHWRRKEAGLINGGYYTAGKIACGGETFTPPTLCLLEHKAGKGANASEVIVATKEAEQTSGQYLPQQTSGGKTYMQQTDVDVLLERLRRNERGQEASVTDPRSLKDPTR